MKYARIVEPSDPRPRTYTHCWSDVGVILYVFTSSFFHEWQRGAGTSYCSLLPFPSSSLSQVVLVISHWTIWIPRSPIRETGQDKNRFWRTMEPVHSVKNKMRQHRSRSQVSALSDCRSNTCMLTP